MANKEQLAILKQGVAAWNKWREEHPDAKIDLRGAKLDGLDLSGVNFRKADIRGTNFRKALLICADITSTKTGRDFKGKFMHFIYSLIAGFSALMFVVFAAISIALIIVTPLIPHQEQLSYISISIACLLPFSIAGFVICSAIAGTFFYTSFSVIILTVIFILSAIFTIISESENYNKIELLFTVICISSSLISLFVSYCITKEFYLTILFRKIGLIGLTFFGTDFRETDLTGAIFDNSYLKHVRFGKAILIGTSFKGTQGLQFARCNGTILEDRDVRKLLVRGKGQGLSLKGKNLQGAYLVNADLLGLDLRETDLMQANLSGTDITGAKLYGSARENWIIDGIRCDYVYWDEAGEQRTPPDRNFRPGEFEELYRQLPTFEYVFANGFTPLDPLIMDRVVQAINERHEEFSLELVNFDKRGEPHATFTVCHLDYVEKAKEQIAAGYEQNRIEPERQDQLMKIISKLIDNNAMMAGNQSKSLDIIKQLGDAAMRDKYSITVGNGGQVGGIGDHAAVSGNTFQQVIYSNDFQLNISDLSRLHEAMRNTAASPEQQAAAEDVAKAAQAARQQDEPTMRQHLKNAGQWALDCAKEIGTEALAEYLKKITVG